MRIINKILFLFVAAAMAAGLFAGCGKLYATDINWNPDFDNKPAMRIMFPWTSGSDMGGSHTAGLIEEVTGYSTIYRQASASNADQDVNNALVNRENYHAMKVTPAQYDPGVIKGSWLDLSEILEKTEYGRTLYDIIDLLPGAWDSVRYTDPDTGETGIYAIPECGYVTMEDFALIWNVKHLEEIGWYEKYDDIPQTTGELDEALYALQDKFGGPGTQYFAFGLPGTHNAEVEPIQMTFGVEGYRFFVDQNDKIQFNIYHESTVKYVSYMNKLRKDNIISAQWQNASSDSVSRNFATGKASVVYLPYWQVRPLLETVVASGTGTLLPSYGLPNTYDAARNQLVKWNTRLRGDGTHGSVVQEKAMHYGGLGGNAYYVVIPKHKAWDALYTVHYMSLKLQGYAYFYGGKPGVDWIEVDAPADGKEDFAEKIIYMQPWSYVLNGQTITGGGKWIQLTPSYMSNIVNNSQFATGANVVEARSLFHLRETGFDAWPIAIPPLIDDDGNAYLDDSLVINHMELHPTFKWWSPISILARTDALFAVASAIDANDPEYSINLTRQALKTTRFSSINNVRYYYWSDNISDEMTDWYWNVKMKGG